MQKKVILCILDGLGFSEKKDNNAFYMANTPMLDRLLLEYPSTQINASGSSVGLPEHQMGNSEVGHMTIGSGRVIKQDFVRINDAIQNNTIAKCEIIRKIIAYHKLNKQTTCHIIGLISDGGVHGHIDHIIYLINLLSAHNVNIVIHAITDGRDVLPKSAHEYLKYLKNNIGNKANIVTISGRYYAMDRDKRLERTQLAYNAIVYGKGPHFRNPFNFVSESISDELITPGVAVDYIGVNKGDTCIITNFRTDRILQLFQMFTEQQNIFEEIVTMTQCQNSHNSIFEPINITNTLGEILSLNHKKQLRLAESEKYAHVTFFFNCGRKKEYMGESRILVPSPKISTYDLQPQMSAYEITDTLIKAISSNEYDFILVNFANADMVGHTGNLNAAIKACEVIDECIYKIVEEKNNMDVIITADHGNVECMFDNNANQPHTAHTTNLVPLILIGKNYKLLDCIGTLADIAPTILDLMKMDIPKEMTGKSLINK